MRFDSIVCGVCLCGVMLSGVPAVAQEVAAEVLLKEEYNEKNNRINEMFQEKVAKISERIALPEEMRSLLIGQADEVREFDIETLKRKLDMKIRQAKERDDLKERLRQDSQNRMKWLMQDEAMFQKNKRKKQVQLPGDAVAAPVQPQPENNVPAAEAAPVPSQPENNAPAAEAAPVPPQPENNVPAAEAAPVPSQPENNAPAAEAAPVPPQPESAASVQAPMPEPSANLMPAPDAASAVVPAAEKAAPAADNRKKRGRFGNRNSRRPAGNSDVSGTLAKETTTFSKQGDNLVKTSETVVVQESQPVVNPDGSVTKAEEFISVKTEETVDPSTVPASAAVLPAAPAVVETPAVPGSVPAAMPQNASPAPDAPAVPAVETMPAAAPALAAQPAPAPAVMDEDMIIMEDSPLIRASEEAFVVDAVAEQKKNEAAVPAVPAPVLK